MMHSPEQLTDQGYSSIIGKYFSYEGIYLNDLKTLPENI